MWVAWWYNTRILHLQHQHHMQVLVHIRDASLLIQLPGYVLGKQWNMVQGLGKKEKKKKKKVHDISSISSLPRLRRKTHPPELFLFLSVFPFIFTVSCGTDLVWFIFVLSNVLNKTGTEAACYIRKSTNMSQRNMIYSEMTLDTILYDGWWTRSIFQLFQISHIDTDRWTLSAYSFRFFDFSILILQAKGSTLKLLISI